MTVTAIRRTQIGCPLRFSCWRFTPKIDVARFKIMYMNASVVLEQKERNAWCWLSISQNLG